MDSYLFGSGVPKFVVGSTEIDIANSFIEGIELQGRTLEHESIINANRNWVDISDYDHITVTILKRLHKHTTSALGEFKNNLYAYNKTEVDAFYPSQTADPFSDKDGSIVKFRLEITEFFPLENPWAYDNVRLIFKSKKPVNLSGLQVTSDFVVPTDTAGLFPTDTSGVAPTD